MAIIVGVRKKKQKQHQQQQKHTDIPQLLVIKSIGKLE